MARTTQLVQEGFVEDYRMSWIWAVFAQRRRIDQKKSAAMRMSLNGTKRGFAAVPMVDRYWGRSGHCARDEDVSIGSN
jgi:hypothetical protein